MSFITPELLSTALHWSVGSLLVFAMFSFIGWFWMPAIRLGKEIGIALSVLKETKAKGPVLDLDLVARDAMVNEALQHGWSEFRDTLHGERRVNQMGVQEVVRWRASAMANTFFTEQTLVDAPLRTEFYKHLPGILTGLGIIGTFAGLILGLGDFKINPDDAKATQESLAALIQTVGGAFIVSGSAICLAMLVTTIEKLLLNRRYTQVEELCVLIDSLFDSGVGEEYLQRLVEASETSATQTMQMKDSLVTDLKQVLTELTQQQIATITATSNQLGQNITQSLTEGLKDPLNRISEAVHTVGGNQSDAVNRLLTDVLSGFTAQMESMFGSQMRGMNEMLVQTASTIEAASQKFDALASNLEKAGSGAADAMAQKMENLMQSMQARQAEADRQMTEFIDGLKDRVAKGQADSAELSMKMMQELSESVHGLVSKLQSSAQQSEEAHTTRQRDFAKQSQALIESQSEQVESMRTALLEASSAMQEAVNGLKSSTHQNIERMAQGADRLSFAASTFADSLGGMTDAVSGIEKSSAQIASTSSALSTAATTLQQGLMDHRTLRDSLAGMLTELRGVLESTRRDASTTAQLVDTLRTASQLLSNAQTAAGDYLGEVNKVLEETHASFARQIEQTLRVGNAQFHTELAQAVGLLKGAIQELGDVLDTLPSAR